MSGPLLPRISDPPTSELLRLRTLAILNGARSTQELRRQVEQKKKESA
jgi:hypothetical protein